MGGAWASTGHPRGVCPGMYWAVVFTTTFECWAVVFTTAFDEVIVAILIFLVSFIRINNTDNTIAHSNKLITMKNI